MTLFLYAFPHNVLNVSILCKTAAKYILKAHVAQAHSPASTVCVCVCTSVCMCVHVCVYMWGGEGVWRQYIRETILFV